MRTESSTQIEWSWKEKIEESSMKFLVRIVSMLNVRIMSVGNIPRAYVRTRAHAGPFVAAYGCERPIWSFYPRPCVSPWPSSKPWRILGALSARPPNECMIFNTSWLLLSRGRYPETYVKGLSHLRISVIEKFWTFIGANTGRMNRSTTNSKYILANF